MGTSLRNSFLGTPESFLTLIFVRTSIPGIIFGRGAFLSGFPQGGFNYSIVLFS